MPRDVDWRSFLNRLTYCFGCGKFGVPRKGRSPMGWKMLYQPHADGPPGLQVCSDKCADLVREAMKNGPITEPLKIGGLPMMDAELRSQMLSEMTIAAEDRLRNEQPYVFPCITCKVKLNPMMSSGIPKLFSCPKCGTDYVTKSMGPGQVAFDRIVVTKTSTDEHEFNNEDHPDGSWYTFCRRCWNDDRGDSSWMNEPCPGEKEEDDHPVPRPAQDDP